MAAGLTDHVWTLREVILFRVPPWPQPAEVGARRVVESGKGRGPAPATCVRRVGVESVTRGERAAGIP